MKLQQTLGSASIAYKESNFDGTLSKLEQLQKMVAEWRAAVVAKKAAGAAPVEPEKEPEPPAESVEFFVNQTHVPDKCKRKAEEGATMRVHYVGKLLTGAWASKCVCKQVSTSSSPFTVHLCWLCAAEPGAYRGACTGRVRTSLTRASLTDLRTCCGQGRRRCLPRPSTRARRRSSSSSARARCSRGGRPAGAICKRA